MADVKCIKLGNTTYNIKAEGPFKGDIYTDDIMSETLVGGSGVEVLSFSNQDNHWHLANTKVDDTITIDGELELGSMGDLGANMQAEINNAITKCTYQTTEPTSAISDNGVHIVYLSSEPQTKYSGYIYFIAES